MTHVANSPWFQSLQQERQKERILKRFSAALAQSVQLNIETGDFVLAAVLDQPLVHSNREALEKWVTEQLTKEGIKADQSALELLSNKLRSQLSEVIA